MLVEQLFNRQWVNVVGSANDEIFGTPGHPQVAVFVHPSQIARIHPARSDKSTQVVGVVQVASEHAGPAHGDHADLIRYAVSHPMALGIKFDNFDLAVGHRMPHTAQADGAVRVRHGVHTAGFGHAVNLQYRCRKALPQCQPQRHGDGRTTATDDLDAGGVGVA